jgi:hypothetical protein
MPLTKSELYARWQVVRGDWYSIYQWEHLSGEAYEEWISEWICDESEGIKLHFDGLRKRSFRIGTHCGQLKRSTDDYDRYNEKRLVRAMFNHKTLPEIGEVIDYEVPLKEAQTSDHGDIDLLCHREDSLLCVEAKAPKSDDSIIKAVLQSFVYTSLVASCRLRFLADFGISSSARLIPSVLTFSSASSGKQLATRDTNLHLLRLIETINETLRGRDIGQLQFYVVEDRSLPMDKCLVGVKDEYGAEKPMFRSGFPWTITRHSI